VNDDDRVFKALADPTRRFLLDLLFARDGRTLTELESELEMTRFGVMKHLRVLEDAGVVITRRAGREKLHFLNPVPVRLIHDRWIDKYTERQVSALTDLKAELENTTMTNATQTTQTVQVHRVYIKATPQAIWDAITNPEWTQKYGYGGRSEYDLRPGGGYRGLANPGMIAAGAPEVAVDGEVIEAEPPRKLVQTWRMLMDPALAEEGFTRLTYEINEGAGGITTLTVTHDLTGAPNLAALMAGELEDQGAGGGWSWVLSDLKTLLETGTPFRG
jgi:uncharacterized protein YndB with AHSA1/START domain/DNA-binding transcriptional ArsR family regulator